MIPEHAKVIKVEDIAEYHFLAGRWHSRGAIPGSFPSNQMQGLVDRWKSHKYEIEYQDINREVIR